MKKLKKIIAAVFITAAMLSAGGAYAQQSEAQIRASLIQQVRVLILELIEDLQEQLEEALEAKSEAEAEAKSEAEAEAEAESEAESESEDDYEVTESDSYPDQTTNEVRTSAKAINSSGVNNDYAEFEIEFDLRAFGSESYISEDFLTSFDFSVESGGSTVYDSDGIQNGSVIASFSVDAELDNRFYRIDEDESEEFEIVITYKPYGGTPVGSGSYRLQLDGVHYQTSLSGADQIYNTSNLTRFRTKSVNIID
jgi:hypothetical protein